MLVGTSQLTTWPSNQESMAYLIHWSPEFQLEVSWVKISNYFVEQKERLYEFVWVCQRLPQKEMRIRHWIPKKQTEHTNFFFHNCNRTKQSVCPLRLSKDARKLQPDHKYRTYVISYNISLLDILSYKWILLQISHFSLLFFFFFFRKII